MIDGQNDLTTAEGRSIYELLRLHFLAINDQKNVWHIAMDEHEEPGGVKRISITIDVHAFAGHH
jgi:hypothetical protein